MTEECRDVPCWKCWLLQVLLQHLTPAILGSEPGADQLSMQPPWQAENTWKAGFQQPLHHQVPPALKALSAL